MKFAPPTANVLPKKSSALGSPENVRSFETMWVSANAMLSVPSVTMNAGNPTSVTRPPFSTPKATQVRIPSAIARSGDMPFVDGELRHDDLSERHHGSDREVDPGRQDHERLADREHADDHHLLQHEREVLGVQEAIGLDREEGHRQQQRDERPDGRRGEHAKPELARAGSPARVLR